MLEACLSASAIINHASYASLLAEPDRTSMPAVERLSHGDFSCVSKQGPPAGPLTLQGPSLPDSLRKRGAAKRLIITCCPEYGVQKLSGLVYVRKLALVGGWCWA